MTTSNGKRHLVQVVSESQYWYKVQFCDGPAGQISEVPKGQVVRFDTATATATVSTPIPTPSFVTPPPTPTQTALPDTRPLLVQTADNQTPAPATAPKKPNPPQPAKSKWSGHWTHQIQVKDPLWGRYGAQFQYLSYPNLALGFSYLNWSTNRTKNLGTGAPSVWQSIHHGHQIEAFGRYYAWQRGGPYIGSGLWYGAHKYRDKVTNPTFPSYNYESEEWIRRAGSETQFGFMQVLRSHLSFDLGFSLNLVVYNHYLNTPRVEYDNVFQARLYAYVGYAF